MKKHLKQTVYLFLVALIVCAVSCSNNVKSMSQPEISYALYRELQKNIVYEVNSSSQYQRTAAGALLDGKGVCEDYSLSYKKLMNGAGIQTVCVEGKDRTVYTEPTVAHMWNRINLNGQWYNANAT